MEDAQDPHTGALYTQLWALATCEEDARAALAKHMQLCVRLLGLLVSRLVPSLSSAALTERTIAIVAMIEGFNDNSSSSTWRHW